MRLRDKISTNRFKGDIIQAEALQNEASFYTSLDLTNPHISIFKSRISEIYVGDKHKVNRFFNAFAGQVMPSVEACETIYSQLYRVWDSADRVREYNFRNTDLYDEALSYIGKTNQFWLTDFWEGFKHQFCSFIVVDLPEIQTTARPDPYLFILNISDVLFIEPTNEGKVKEIIFKSIEAIDGESKEYWYWYTDTFYSKYLIDGENEIIQFVNNHKLGRCPVHKLWNDKLNKSSWILTKGVITPNYEDLFWLIVKTIESRKADLLYLNPIRQVPKISCGYDSTKNTKYRYSTNIGDGKCVGGWLYTLDGKIPVTEEDGSHVLCPVCGKQRNASGGAGNEIVIDLDAQAVKDGKVNISSNLVRFITPEIEGTEAQYKRIIELFDRIIKHCVGSDDQPTESAVNELQQQAIFESKESVLKRIAEGISFVKTAVERDQLELRYASQFISNKHSQGTKFYLTEVKDLLEMREKSNNPIQKRQIDEQILEVKFRNDQKRFNEEKLLYKLLPYNTLTDEEFIGRVDVGKILDSEAIGLRFQFSNAVELFESEFGSIIEFFTYKFAENIPEIKRIELIRGLLIGYIKIEKNVQNQVS